MSAMEAGFVGASLAFNLQTYGSNHKDESNGNLLAPSWNKENCKAKIMEILQKRHIEPGMEKFLNSASNILTWKNSPSNDAILAAKRRYVDIFGGIDDEIENCLDALFMAMTEEVVDGEMVDDLKRELLSRTTTAVLPPLKVLVIYDKKSYTYFNSLIYVEVEFESRSWMINTYDELTHSLARESMVPAKPEKSVIQHQVSMGPQGPQFTRHEVDLEQQLMPLDCFYPNFKKPIDQVFQEFMNSTKSILFLYGPPGTGKTTLLRKLMLDYGREVFYSTSGDVLAAGVGSMVLDKFYSATEANIFFMEEIDTVVESRENGGSAVSALLNSSDGLISRGKSKKLVMVCNLQNLKSVDKALLRPGRCYDTVYVGHLSSEQAQTVAKELGVEFPQGYFYTKSEWTLAEAVDNNVEKVTPDNAKPIRPSFGITG